MKVLVALCVLALVALSAAGPQRSKRCIYVNGHCFRQCEPGTYSYGTGCGYLTPEATCDQPNPVADTRGHLCDFSACYCNPPTVRDSVSRKCVKLEDCPPKKEENEQQKEQNEQKKEQNEQKKEQNEQKKE